MLFATMDRLVRVVARLPVSPPQLVRRLRDERALPRSSTAGRIRARELAANGATSASVSSAVARLTARRGES